jgi:YVTN family beta-propeller protein
VTYKENFGGKFPDTTGYFASISWGDGTASQATVSCGIQLAMVTCMVTGTHTYSVAMTGISLGVMFSGHGISDSCNSKPFNVVGSESEPCGTGIYPFPYTDVAGVTDPFCPGIMEAYVTAVSKGTTPTTFSPNTTVTRVQMTTFLQRSVDQGLARTSRRAALNQWWAPENTASMQTITVGGEPLLCAADGENIWVSNFSGNAVVQVQASTGKLLGTWTGATDSLGVLAAVGKVFVAGQTLPGDLYVIDPTKPPGALTSVATLGNDPDGIAFDGTNLWTTNFGPTGSVSIINPQSYSVNTVITGFNAPFGILYDGAHIWVADYNAGKLLKLNPSGNILQSVIVGTAPGYPVFDGTNIWVPNIGSNSITVVQASTGDVVATITSDANNQLNVPFAASFDGERVLVTNNGGNSVTVFKAADLSFIANVPTGTSTGPYGACSDGINFWVPLQSGNLLRF